MRTFYNPAQADSERGKRSRIPTVLFFGLCMLVAPLVFEGGKVFVGNWMSVTGSHYEPDTPILDAIGTWSRETRVDMTRYSSRYLSGGTWRASTAVPLAIAWAVVMGVVFLRRVR